MKKARRFSFEYQLKKVLTVNYKQYKYIPVFKWMESEISFDNKYFKGKLLLFSLALV